MGVELAGIPETALWTLYMRASEAARPDSVIDDPQAVRLLEQIDYPFEERFGAPHVGQWQALRARAFDAEIERFLAARPDGTVVALGEGLETAFQRTVDNGRVRWLSVELPEMAALRRELLPGAPNLRLIERSALDESWMDEVDPERGVLLTAQGLLMYFEPEQVHGLIEACRSRFAGGGLIFDAIPRWLSERSKKGLKGPSGYEPPPWLWGIDTNERRRLGARRLRAPHGRGLAGSLLLPQLLYVLAIRF